MYNLPREMLNNIIYKTGDSDNIYEKELVLKSSY